MEFGLSDYLPHELLENFHFIILGALLFGIGGYPLGIDMYQEGSSIVFLGVMFFLVAAYWGGVLGFLTGDLKNVKGMVGAGIFAGIACLFIANIGGLVLFALMGWLLFLTPPLFLVLMVYYFKKNEKLISLAFFMLLIYVIVDWIFIIHINPSSTSRTIFSLHAFVFALTGLITGSCYGWVIGKTKIMAIFGLIGFSMGSYWIGIFYHLFESSNNAVYGFVITYILLSVFAGAFLVAGLYYPQEKIDTQIVLQSSIEQNAESEMVDVTQ